jgi:diguanylate cyclase (GGDEF)-like protein
VAESFRHQARHDMLTGLANRTYLYERMREVFDEPQNPAAALYVLDLDNFKQVNDSLGHEYGDQLLAQISGRLSRRLRNSDLVARLGGDEFAIIQAECFGAAHAAEMAARVVEMCVTPIEIGTLELRVGASVGVAVSPHHGTESAMLLRRADAAMYAAKFSGGGSRVYSPELDRLQTLGRSEADRPTDLRPAGASHAAWGDPVTAQ